jgi:beta-phosphoglucomutase family hydrolase
LSPSSAAPYACIFDWDGVIIDSSRAHEESWERLALEINRPLPPGHFVKGFGSKNEFIVPEILGWTRDLSEIHRLSLRKEALYRQVVQERGQPALPGARAWLERLATAGIPCAIGSSTHRDNIELILGLTDLREFFQAIVTAEDVSLGKPDPEVCLTAAARLGYPPDRCIVFEDALVGLAAARAGGMRVIAVATTHRADELTEADQVVHRLDELYPETLAGWFHS